MSQLASYYDDPPIRWGLALPIMGAVMAIIALIGVLSIEAAGLIYIICFIGLMIRRPELGLMVIIALSPIAHNIAPLGPVNFTVSDFSLILAALVLFCRSMVGRRRLRIGPLLIPLVLYLGVCFGSVIVNLDQGAVAAKTFAQMLVYFFAAIIVFASTVDRKDRLLPALYGLIAMGVIFALMVVFSGGYGVFGIHKNSVGASLSIVVIVAVELWFSAPDKKRQKLLGVCLVVLVAGLFFSLSRGSWMAAFIGCSIIILMRGQFKMMMRLGLVSIPVLIVCWLLLPEAASEYAFDISVDAHNTQTRLVTINYTWAVFKDNPILGVGLGFRKQVDATNIVMVTLAETGMLGLATLVSIHAVFLWMVWWAQKRLRRDDPLFSLLAIGAGAIFGHLAHGLVDHYWSRGILTTVWASAGMATLAYLTVRQRELWKKGNTHA